MTRPVNRPVDCYTGSRRDGSKGFATGLLTLLILFLFTAAGVAWVSMGIVASERWPIRWLEVNGTFQRVSAEQLRANLASRVGENFFTVDLQSLQAGALRLSWVSAARVQKQWPDTVRVEVEEYVPVALEQRPVARRRRRVVRGAGGGRDPGAAVAGRAGRPSRGGRGNLGRF